MRTTSRLTSAAAAASLAALGLATLSAQRARPAALQDARTFLERANADMLRLSNRANRAGWVQSTYITPDTEALSAEATGALVSAVTAMAQEAARFDGVDLPPGLRRQMTLLENALPMAAPPDRSEAEELTRLVASMESTYGRGSYCPGAASGEACLDINEITRILAEDRDPARLLDVWQGWHRIAIPMKDDYARS
jgi:peptidyl-dipeptidase A